VGYLTFYTVNNNYEKWIRNFRFFSFRAYHTITEYLENWSYKEHKNLVVLLNTLTVTCDIQE